MNSVFVLCVGMLAAAPAPFESQNPQPVQTAANNYGILPAGCYGQPSYRSPLAQNVPVGYSGGSANCANGQCAPLSAANCPNGWCGTTTSYNARPYSPVSYSQGTANCPNGQCQTPSAYGARPTTCYDPNCPQHGTGNYSPASYDSRYNTRPATRYPASYSQPRYNAYPVSRPVNGNWSSTSRNLPTSTYGTSSSPFFSE